MSNQQLAACFYPTTVALVDDNEGFLQLLKFKLKKHGILSTCFETPHKCLEFFNQVYRQKPLANDYQNWLDKDGFDNRVINVNFKAIHKKVFDPKRFNNIAVIIVDYAMPLINGLEMLQQIDFEYPVKKILLTGEADEKIAVDAFNQGIIHGFIRKDARYFEDELFGMINKLQLDHFQNLSKFIINLLTEETYMASCLDDPKYIDFFNKLIKKHNIIEYYLLDENGSFLTLNKQGKLNLLVIKNNTVMEADYEVAKDYHDEVEPVSKPILKGLKDKKKILYLHQPADFKLLPVKWKPFLHPAKILQGREIYYYAYITMPKSYTFDRILSYQAYLKQST